ncbi:sulfatase-like hydrolase/transferase [Porphyromonas pogonae]|uniref:sulfatase-like hydrolase/transferase n=1 Tax=Porphyromonas pogonae TaxID=867595 RepID=UPI002E763E02|nr:sulfatase-like hydrolase/transferase [Porphyromonas pogonae]
MKTVILPIGFASLFPASLLSQNIAEQLPNIIMIVADDVGYGDLHCYAASGVNTVKTPHVDRLAKEGCMFTDAHACAATSTPSRYGILTGLYPWRRQDTGIAAGDAKLIISPETLTLADVMKSAGYHTAAIGKWHLGLGAETGRQDWNTTVAPGPKEIGFDYSYIMAATADRTPCVYMENQRVVNLDPKDPIEVSYTHNFPGQPTGKSHPELLTKLKPSHGHDMSIVNGISRIGYMRGGRKALWKDENIADSITAHAVKYIEEHSRTDQPFFLYFCTNDIHVPRVPHPRYAGATDMGPRGDAIAQFDGSVGQVLAAIDSMGITQNTLVILTSDNGPVVDDGYQDQAVEKLGRHKPWGPFRGGKYSAFEAGTRVPFIVRWPAGKVRAGSKSRALISHVDLMGSLAKIVSSPEYIPADSRDELAALLGKTEIGRAYVIEASHTLSVISDGWKYIEPKEGNSYQQSTNTELGILAQPQLYDLVHDPAEYTNVASDNPEIVKRLQEILERERKKL